jgi:hypothetical protein
LLAARKTTCEVFKYLKRVRNRSRTSRALTYRRSFNNSGPITSICQSFDVGVNAGHDLGGWHIREVKGDVFAYGAPQVACSIPATLFTVLEKRVVKYHSVTIDKYQYERVLILNCNGRLVSKRTPLPGGPDT